MTARAVKDRQTEKQIRTQKNRQMRRDGVKKGDKQTARLTDTETETQ